MKKSYIAIIGLIFILIIGAVIIFSKNNASVNINEIINKNTIKFIVEKAEINIEELKIKINIIIQYEDNIFHCCYPVNWEFYNIDKIGSHSFTGGNIKTKTGVGEFELILENLENIPDSIEMIIYKMNVVLYAFDDNKKDEEYVIEGEWKINIELTTDKK